MNNYLSKQQLWCAATIVGSGVCNPPFLFSTHPFYENTLYTEFYNPPFYYGLWHLEVWTTSNILIVMLLVLEIISLYLTMSIKKNSYNQHFVNSYNVWMFWNEFYFSSQYGYIIHCKHNSTDRSLHFINHQIHPFYFWTHPSYKTTLYTKPPFIPMKSSIPPFYQFWNF